MKISRPSNVAADDFTMDDGNDISETSYSTVSPFAPSDTGSSTLYPSIKSNLETSTLRPSSSVVAKAIGLYFDYCHRQPIWCFERHEVDDQDWIPKELVCSIIALTARFSRDRDQLCHYGNTAKNQIMFRVANGTVDLATIESLCLLSYSSFIGMHHIFLGLK